jgi:hypothetical protein
MRNEPAKTGCRYIGASCRNQADAIDFINTVIARFPFRIREIRTDNGQEFQAEFHWHSRTKVSARLYQTWIPAAQRQSRTVTPNRRAGILSAPHLHRRYRPWREALRMGTLLQPVASSRCIQRKGTLRGPSRTVINQATGCLITVPSLHGLAI